MISIDGHPMLAIYGDVYPASLGKKLMAKGKSMAMIIAIAQEQIIEAASASVKRQLFNARVAELAEIHGLSEKEIREDLHMGGFLAGRDWFVRDIVDYDDWMDWQYDIREKGVFLRALNGKFPQSIEDAGPFKKLTCNEVMKDEV